MAKGNNPTETMPHSIVNESSNCKVVLCNGQREVGSRSSTLGPLKLSRQQIAMKSLKALVSSTWHSCAVRPSGVGAQQSPQMWGDLPFGAELKGKNFPQIMGQVFPSASTLCTLQVLQPGAETVHLVGELSNATVLLSSVCLTTVKKIPRGKYA